MKATYSLLCARTASLAETITFRYGFFFIEKNYLASVTIMVSRGCLWWFM